MQAFAEIVCGQVSLGRVHGTAAAAAAAAQVAARLGPTLWLG